MSRKEENRMSFKVQDKSATSTTQKGKNKFVKKEPETQKYLMPIDNIIRRMTAGDIIKKTEANTLDCKLTLQDVQYRLIQNNGDNTNSESYLHQLKKGHDQLVKLSSKKQLEATRMKEQIEMIKKKLKSSSNNSEDQRKYIDGMEKRWETLKLKQETTALSSKTLQHMLDRMKKDQVVHQLKINDLQNRVREMTSQLNQITTKNMNLHEFEALSTIAVSEVKESYTEAHCQRKKDIAHYESLINKRKQADHREEERQRITEDIQAMAASDLNDSNMIRWKRLLLVQKFMKRMLKSKILALEMKYSDVKNAFYTIKMRTNISDPNSLTNCYLSLQDTYQKLLETVRHLEGKMEQLQSDKLDLDKAHDQVKTQILMLQQDRDSKIDTGLAKRAYELTEKCFQSDLAEERIYFWLINNIYKLDMANQRLLGTRARYYQLYPKEQMAQHLYKFCEQLVRTSEVMAQTEHQVIRYEKLRCLQATTNRDFEHEDVELQKDIPDRRDMAKKATRNM